MSAALTPVTDEGAWAREHKACFELAPLIELVKGRGVKQTGYELSLFARFDPAAQDDAGAVARGLHEGLRALALEALRGLPAQALVRVQPFSRGVVPAETSFVVEVELTVVVSPSDPDLPPPPAETRRKIATLEGRLRSMGLYKRT